MQRPEPWLRRVCLIRPLTHPWWSAGLWCIVAVVNLILASIVALRPDQLGDLHFVRNWLQYWIQSGHSPYTFFGAVVDYPPVAFLILWPLALPADASLTAWYLPVAIIVGIAAGWMALAWIAESMAVVLSVPERVALVALLMSGSGARLALWHGQTVALSFLFGAVAMRYARRAPFLAGLMLALCSFKPHVALGFGIALVLTGGMDVLLIASAMVLTLTWLFAITVNHSLLGILNEYAWNLVTLYGGPHRVRGLLSIRHVLDDMIGYYSISTTFYLALAAASLAVMGWLARTRANDRSSRTLITICAVLWSLLFVPHQRYDILLATPILWLMMWPESGIFRDHRWQLAIVAAYMGFGVIDLPLLLRELARRFGDQQTLFWLSYWLGPIRVVAVFVLGLWTLWRLPRVPTHALRAVEPLSRARHVLTDPVSAMAIITWLAIVAFYLVPGVPVATLKHLGETYSTMPIWPWAIVGALIDLQQAPVNERRTWRWLAISFALLFAIEGVRAIAQINGQIDRLSEWFYMAFYGAQWFAAASANSDGGATRRTTLAIVATTLAAGGLLTAAAVWWPTAYAHGGPSSAVYLTFDLITVAWWWQTRQRSSPRLALAWTGFALAAAAFFVTDALAMLSRTGVSPLAAGRATDLIWTLPTLLYAVSVRMGRDAVAARL